MKSTPGNIRIDIYDKTIRISRPGDEAAVVIDRKSGSQLSQQGTDSILIASMRVIALFGTFIIPGRSRKRFKRFLVACIESNEVGTLPTSFCPVYKVKKCLLIPYEEPAVVVSSDSYTVDRRSTVPMTPDELEEERIKSSIEKLLSSGTFFYSDDLTGLTTRFQDRSSSSLPPREWTDQFLWNFELGKNFGTQFFSDLKKSFPLSPLIQGYVGSRSIPNSSFGMTLITRRSTKQAGTRFNARGIDDEGNVAIFCETDMIITNTEGGGVFAYTVIRGSVPVFWSQSANSGSVELTRNFELTKNACDKHLEILFHRYKKPIVFVNLLSQSKSGETQLSTAMANHLARASPGSTSLVEFDFHKHVDQSRKIQQSLEPLMDRLRPFIFHSYHWTNSSSQSGILRVNCLDCLDRTNIVQMMIAKEALSLFGSKIEKLGEVLHSDSFQDSVFTELWIKNGDAISKGYSGTGSVLSRLVQNAGKTSKSAQLTTVLEHSWRSANRYIKGNWDDGERNEAIMRVLQPIGETMSSPPVSPPPTRSVSDSSNLSVWMGTWNLHGLRLGDIGLGVFNGWVQLSDILIFNFQEVVDLNSISTVIFSSRGDDERNKSIDVEIVKHLSSLSSTSDYVQVSVESMVGLYTSIFIRRKFVDQIDHVKTARLKAGFGGATGNKGAVSVSFRLFKQLEIDVVNIHLDSGEYRAEERMNQLAYILSNTRVGTNRHHHSVVDKFALIGGDFNFRCDGIEPLLALELIDRNRLEKLRVFDPYLSSNTNILKICQFKEMPLLFAPTYKYEQGGILSEKRTPSWCDRIFYRMVPSLGRFGIEPKDYASVPTNTYSDHKPVFSVFEIVPVVSDPVLVHSSSLPDMHRLRETNQPTPPLIDLLSGDTASSPISEVPSRTFDASSSSSAAGGEWTLDGVEDPPSTPSKPPKQNEIPDLLL